MNKIQRALISVSDKKGIVELSHILTDSYNIELIATGSTAKLIKDSGIAVTEVSEYTQSPEILGGRVKTLHPAIHGGILNIAGNSQHADEMQQCNIKNIDLVIVNLYPFKEVSSQSDDIQECIENIDIGGPAMIRASAKNYNDVTVLTEKEDYAELLTELERNQGATSKDFRFKMATKAFAITARYDAMISDWFNKQQNIVFPKYMNISCDLVDHLRYGENPHQRAGLYLNNHDVSKASIIGAQQLQGKQLSYNNINDSDVAVKIVREFSEPSVAIIKHCTPCGVAVADNTVLAYEKALACDPVSAFGGIVAVNGNINAELAQKMSKIFLEVIIASSIDGDAREILSSKKNTRLLIMDNLASVGQKMDIKTIDGGFLIQDYDSQTLKDYQCVTERQPDSQEIDDLLFAFKVVKHVKSNAIVLAHKQATIGIGTGQTSRLDAVAIAIEQMNKNELFSEQTVLASDAFFPFADGLALAGNAGIRAVIQPAGSIRDQEVIDCANKSNIAMLTTSGLRCFKH